MPVYEYKCKACQREFEYQQRMSDPEKTVCEACGGELERLISRTAFSLKGGGWYKDLYSSAKPETAAKDGGGDAKPAATDGGAAAATPATPSTPSGGTTGGGTTGGGGSTGGGSTGGGSTGGGSSGGSTGG